MKTTQTPAAAENEKWLWVRFYAMPLTKISIDQRFLSTSFSTSAPLLVTPKRSNTPYHWLTPGYCKDKVKTTIFVLPFAATYVTFPSTPWNWFQHPRLRHPAVEEWARGTEVNDDDHSLFMVIILFFFSFFYILWRCYSGSERKVQDPAGFEPGTPDPSVTTSSSGVNLSGTLETGLLVSSFP